MFVVLCRGDENEAQLEAFGPFDTESEADQWSTEVESGNNCPNEHEVIPVYSMRVSKAKA